MIDERRIRAAVQAEASTVNLPDNLWPEILTKARRSSTRGWWARLTRLPQAGLAFVVVLLLMGAGYMVAKPVDRVPQPTIQTQVATVDQISARVGFRVLMPVYLPPAVELLESRLEADGVQPDAQFRIAALYFMTPQGRSGVAIKEWRSAEAAAFPPGDSHAQAFHASSKKQVDLNGRPATLVTGTLSGLPFTVIYRYTAGVSYAVSGWSSEELLKVAASLQ